VFLLPSELESFGLAALEAEACEVPVIATRIGGIPEVVTDGETGYLSDIGDIAKMSEDTLKLLNDEEMRLAFGVKGREQALTRYGSDKIIPQYISFYEQVLNRKADAMP
jgi:glycosyltransferase involved in cell wall biosynthesis